jgi:hypothetical protein
MTDQQPGADRPVKVEAVQAVVDRVTSWQDGAPEETIRQELLTGLSDAEVDVPSSFVDEVVRRIRESTEHFDVGPLLTADDGS